MTKRPNSSAEWVRNDIDQRGAQIAYETLLEIAQDKTAPAPARATAGVAILRSGGLLDNKKNPRDVEPSEMDSPEMIARLHEIVRSGEEELRLAALSEKGRVEDEDLDADEPDVFG